MNDATQTNWRRWSFGAVDVDERRRELRVDGRAIAIEGKPYALLLALLRRAGETVSKDELIGEVWPGRVVTDGVLTKAVLKLRVALNDQNQQLLRTVHGFGYRLLAPVAMHDADAEPTPEFAGGQTVPLRPNWRFVRRLGRGGYGDVWLAEQVKTREPRVFKYAANSTELAALKREITLSRLLHDGLGARPDLVRVIDWNLDDPPHFIETEYASGGSLDHWCAPRLAAGTLSREQRIAIAADIAEALAAAHSIGVLHKDLKPANVLVQETNATSQKPASIGGDGFSTGEIATPPTRAQIRIADFGSGRVLDAVALAQLRITQLGFATRELADGSSGTPFYLAPELLAGQSPSLASDVFALGVILYQLVIGDFQRPLLPGWEREIDDALLRDDIAAAAEQDPQRRLASAAEFARRLRDLPARRTEAAAVLRREAEWERWRDAARRSRERRPWLIGIGALLLVACSVTAWLAWRASAARREAERRASAQDAVLQFLREDLLSQADPYANTDDDPGIRTLLARARERASVALSTQPDVAVPVLTTIADALVGLGDHVRAREVVTQAQQLAATLPPHDRARLEAERARADLDEVAGDWRDAHEAYVALLPHYLETFGPAHPTTRWIAHQIGWTTYLSGNFAEAATLLCDESKKAALLAGEGGEAQARALAGCALALCRSDHCAQALVPAQRALALTERRHGATSPNVAQVLTALQAAQRGSGDVEGALRTLDRILAILQARVPPNHPALSLAWHERANVLLLLQRPDEALRSADSAVARRSAQFGPAHAYVANSRALRARALTALGRRDEARNEFGAALAIAEKSGDTAIAERIRKAMKDAE
jgi:serine/threonine protein kinase/DNA-binding winged helix-turn-helix (wHTH) protein